MEPTKLEAVKAKIADAQQKLEAQLKALQTSDDWRRTLERMAVLGPFHIAQERIRNHKSRYADGELPQTTNCRSKPRR